MSSVIRYLLFLFVCFFVLIFLFLNYIFNINDKTNLYIIFSFSSYFFYCVIFIPFWFFKLIKQEKLYFKRKKHKKLFKKKKIDLILNTINSIDYTECKWCKDYITDNIKLNKNEKKIIINEYNTQVRYFKKLKEGLVN